MQSPSRYSQTVRQLADGLFHKLAEIDALTASSTDDHLYPQLASVVDDCVIALRAFNIWGSDNRLLSSELWNIAGPLLSRSWLLNRARIKPRGYAGDYEMLAHIYENHLCDDPLGRLIDRYFQQQAAPQAVRNRMKLMADWIVQSATADHSLLASTSAVHIAIVGSAFGLEVRDALLKLNDSARSGVRITLLDLDPAAIQFARDRLSSLLPGDRLTTVSTNIFRLADRPQIAETLRGSHWLFCPGLFDYLDDEAATAMLRSLFEQLAPGGRLTVFQFAPHNPTRAYMEWFGTWYLTYRDAGQFKRLLNFAGLSAAGITFGAEPLGVDLYVTATKGR